MAIMPNYDDLFVTGNYDMSKNRDYLGPFDQQAGNTGINPAAWKQTAGTAATGAATSPTDFKPIDYDAAYTDMGNARKAALDAALLNQQQQYAAQGNALKGQYDDVRGQAYTGNRVSALGNNERMAAIGLAGNAYAAPQSGYSESSRVAQDTALQNALNAASRQEQGARDALATQGNAAMLNRDQQWAAAQADMANQKLGYQTQQNQFAANYGLQRDQFTEQQRLNAQNQHNWQDTFDYQKGRDTVGDQRYTDETNYAHGRDTINDQRYTDETNYAHGRDTINDQRYTDETNYAHGRDTQQQDNWQKSFDTQNSQWQQNFDFSKAQAARAGGGGGYKGSDMPDWMKNLFNPNMANTNIFTGKQNAPILTDGDLRAQEERRRQEEYAKRQRTQAAQKKTYRGVEGY